jgi:type VI secretion system protein ImpJ
MSSIAPTISPIRWYEGMMLSPQHFQQNNLYLEQILHHQLRRVSGDPFGVLSLEIDQSLIDVGVVKIRELHGVMPDGTVVDYRDKVEEGTINTTGQNTSLEFDLSELKNIKPEQKVRLYLALAKQNTNGKNDTRYDEVKSESVEDFFAEQSKVELVRLKARLQLLSKDKLSGNYTYFPIVEVEKSKLGVGFRWTDYAPPCIHVSTRSKGTGQMKTLWQELEKKAAEIRQKTKEQYEYFFRNTEKDNLITFSKRIELTQITQYLPKLTVMLNSHKCHPFDIYLTCLDMAGSMSMSLNNGLTHDYQKYDHENLNHTFQGILNLMDAVSDKLNVNLDVSNFELADKGWFSLSIANMQETSIYLVFKVRLGINKEEAARWVDKALIYTFDKQQSLFTARLSGATRKRVKSFSELNLLEGEDELFYEIDLKSDYIQITEEQGLLTIQTADENLDSLKPTAITLFQKKPKEDNNSQGDNDNSPRLSVEGDI